MSSSTLVFDPIRLPPECAVLREEVREFLAQQVRDKVFDPRNPLSNIGSDKAFAQRDAQHGWIGLTWPRAYGGQERSYLERFVLAEEFYAANAPVRHFYVADRQCGPMLIAFGADKVARDVVPRIARGELSFCIGMSEAGSGSDLFAARARADKVADGWLINGAKTWVTNAHLSDYMVGYFRTEKPTEQNRRGGISCFLIDMRSKGITVNPIRQMTGEADFNEVVFDDVWIPEDHLIGTPGKAAEQATTELSYERAGPERFLETFYLLPALLEALGREPDNRAAEGLGQLVAQLHTMRRMSVSVAGMLQAGLHPVVEAALVKDLGTTWEQSLPSKVRTIAATLDRSGGKHAQLDAALAMALKMAPKFTLAGGTNEILRGIIARGLGVR
jgi:alkylation response protein AidB-like acyl-CoA dehydrogenase